MPRAVAPRNEPTNLALTDAAARQLTNATKSSAQLDTITPRWLIQMLQWVPARQVSTVEPSQGPGVRDGRHPAAR